MSTENTNRYIEFSLGHERYAIPLMMVKEVISVPSPTPIPNSSPCFLGIVNLRGSIISIVDLRTKLKIKKNDELHEESVIIIDAGHSMVGLVVDSINKVLTFQKEDLSDMPVVETQVDAGFINGIYRSENDLVILLDVVKVLDVKNSDETIKLKKTA